MPTIDSPLTPNTLPPGVGASVSASFSPGRVTLTLNASWDEHDLAQDPQDLLVSIDGRLVFRNQGGSYLPGLVTSSGVVNADRSRTFVATLDADYLGLAPGAHDLALHWLMPSGKVAGVKSYPLVVPSGTSAPQTPPPLVRPGVVVRGLFDLAVSEFRQYGLSPAAVRAAGVNAVTVGAFVNPADWYAGDGPTWVAQVLGVGLAQWDAAWRPRLVAELDWCRANGLLAIVEADDFYRSGRERWWWANCPWRNDAVRAVRDVLRQYPDVVAYVSAVDEVEFVLGGNPVGGLVDVDALLSLWREVPDAPSWCWPGQKPTLYEVPGRADVACRYFREAGAEFSVPLGEGGRSLAQVARVYDVMRGELPPATMPMAAQVFTMGRNYVKRSPGGEPAPAYGDEVISEGTPPAWMPAAVWLPLTLTPARALRGYMFDSAASRDRRAKDGYGSPLQVGVKVGTDRWDALGKAFKSVEAREAALCTRTPLPASYLDNWAAGGVDGLKVSINCGTLARPCPYIVRGRVLTAEGEGPYAGGDVPPGAVVFSE